METLDDFRARREELNEVVLRNADLQIKRFFALDNDAYGDGGLSSKVKELIGLASSTVLRCNDCISYHLGEALDHGASKEEIIETLAIALVVGGSITIPHLRHAIALLEDA
jgi:ribonuclease HI